MRYMEVTLYCARKKRLFFLGILLFIVMLISGIYALNKEIITTESGISTGAVDIKIEEYNGNTQPFDEDGSYVMPGDEIVLIPRVNNLGLDCYLRAKIEYTINGDSFSEIDYIEGNYSSWTKKDNYYYYDSIFTRDSYINLFNKVTIPNLSSAYYGKKVVVHILVEAVQSKNFDGNWDEVNIRESINRSYDIDYEGESSVIYEDSTNNHISLDSDFFNKLGNILPGDSFSEDVTLLNKSNTENEYYLSIDYDNLTNEELALLQKMTLSIKKNGEVLLNGNLANKNQYTLGVYKKGEGDIFKIEISLPKDAENEYSKLFTKIKWKFSYKNLSDGSDSDNPKTGDLGINLYIIVFILSTLGLIIDMIMWKKENKRIE